MTSGSARIYNRRTESIAFDIAGDFLKIVPVNPLPGRNSRYASRKGQTTVHLRSRRLNRGALCIDQQFFEHVDERLRRIVPGTHL
jgi:hypothetical protein